MALGEYVSVSSQRDAERALLDAERRELRDDPAAELAELYPAGSAHGSVARAGNGRWSDSCPVERPRWS
jgi:VIT1/CCC1 family predicted Fe2+/Mn2+ transporter